MRLLFVIDSLGSGGAQRQLVTLAIDMVARGHEVEVFLYHDSNHFEESLTQVGVKIHLVKKTRRFSLKPVWALRRLARKNSYDAILSFLTTPNFYTILSQLFSRNKTPIIISERTSVLAENIPFRKRLVYKLFHLANHLTCNSHHARDYLIQYQKWDEEKISTIWNGLDLETFHSTPIEALHGSRQFIAVGNIMHTKQWLCLLEAMKILNEKHDLKIDVNWVGRLENLGSSHEQYHEKMKQAIKDWQLEDQWHWLGRCSNMPELYAKNMALIHPSVDEGLPNVVCEALACGRPVIASDLLDHPRLIQHGVSGLLFEPYSAIALAAAIHQLCELSQDELIKMSNSARVFAEEHLAVSTLGDQYEQLFLMLTNRSESV